MSDKTKELNDRLANVVKDLKEDPNNAEVPERMQKLGEEITDHILELVTDARERLEQLEKEDEEDGEAKA